MCCIWDSGEINKMAENKDEINSEERLETLNGQQKSEYNSMETGWDRIKSLFTKGEFRNGRMEYLPLTVFIATCMGFLYGGRTGSRYAKERYIAMNHHTKFSSTMQAQRGVRDAGMLGFVRQGSKWGWKMGLFAGIFSGTSILLISCRDKEDGLNFIAAGGITGGLYRMRMGFMPAIGGAVMGLWISFPLGAVVYGFEKLIGREEETERIKTPSEAPNAREIEWEQRLDATSAIIDEMEQQGQDYALKPGTEVINNEIGDTYDTNSESTVK